jgi:hypothetical protein
VIQAGTTVALCPSGFYTEEPIMKSTVCIATAVGAVLMYAAPIAAQAPAGDPVPGAATTTQTEEKQPPEDGRPITMQHFRPLDQRGINMFETPKAPGVEYTGFKIDFGAAFAAQVQWLEHENTAIPVIVNGVDTNQLQDIGFGFNNSTANLYLHAQLARGVRVQLTSYLSSRHQNETWVKDGFLLIDELPVNLGPLNNMMRYVTLRVGHMEVNYGDAHFRRSDNGNAIYSPFVGNYLMDAFTTEVGGEVYVRAKGLIGMGAITGGEMRGTVVTPDQRGPAYIGKAGFDRIVRPNLRVRATGSVYKANKSMNSTLYGGDRAGSRYYWVMENTQATESAQHTSGLLNPGFRNKVTAMQFNPFVKFHGLEFFGVVERAEGKAAVETTERTWNQYAADVVYRFLPREQMYAGLRYNKANGTLVGIPNDVGANRWQLAGGWFITPNVLMKAEYVTQEYQGFPPTHIRNGGKFNGMMLEGVVGF